MYMKIKAGEAALTQKLAAIQAEEKKKVKAVEAEKTAELTRRIGALAELTAMDKTSEKQRSSSVAAEIKVERYHRFGCTDPSCGGRQTRRRLGVTRVFRATSSGGGARRWGVR